MKIRVAICQVDMEWENTARNLKRLEPIVAAADADVVELPEMFATGCRLPPACVAVPAAGLVATLANNIPMFQMMGDMDRRGKIINVAFAVSAAFVFGDHLGFTAGFDAAMIFPMIVGKLVGGVTAVAAAMLLTR